MPQGELISITGHLGRDAEDLVFQSGHVYGLKFSIAVTHRKKNKDTGQWEDSHTNWWNVKYFTDAREEMKERLTRGTCVRVTSRRSELRAYIAKDNGEARIAADLTCNDGDISVVLYAPKSGQSGGYSNKQSYSNTSDVPASSGYASSLRDEPGFDEEFPLDFSDAEVGAGADVDIPF